MEDLLQRAFFFKEKAGKDIANGALGPKLPAELAPDRMLRPHLGNSAPASRADLFFSGSEHGLAGEANGRIDEIIKRQDRALGERAKAMP
jgi:hypothetical protein